MKKIVALLLVAIMAIGLVACKAAPAAGGAAGDGTFKVAIVLAEYNEWNKNYEKKVIEKCEAWGWEYQIFDAKQDANKQIDDVRSVINQGFDAMTIQAVDMAALAPVVEEAADARSAMVFTGDVEDLILSVIEANRKQLMDGKCIRLEVVMQIEGVDYEEFVECINLPPYTPFIINE